MAVVFNAPRKELLVISGSKDRVIAIRNQSFEDEFALRGLLRRLLASVRRNRLQRRHRRGLCRDLIHRCILKIHLALRVYRRLHRRLGLCWWHSRRILCEHKLRHKQAERSEEGGTSETHPAGQSAVSPSRIENATIDPIKKQ